MKLDEFPRFELASLPTPVQPLPRLSGELGIDLWIKRDDLTGLAFGGNKTRKLELLTAHALREGADTLVTVGAPQSNHCRQTAAAAARAGLNCTLVLAGEEPGELQGNILLDRLLGAEVVWARDESMERALRETSERLRGDGHKPYEIPYGGSNAYGVAAYTLALNELQEQELAPDRIVLASSSGGTQSGLLLGSELYGLETLITGISVEPSSAELEAKIERLLETTREEFELEPQAERAAVQVFDDYLGGGYAVVGELERSALVRFAHAEGIILDPVYTGRAAGGLLDLVASGEIEAGERVLFWHTGGTPALFAFNQELSSPNETSS